MDAIHGNGTFWHCWSQDFAALALKGQIFRSQGYPHQVNRTGRRGVSGDNSLWLLEQQRFIGREKKDQSCIF
uniref:Uncharacterized protein n=1 Tax=Felis catus TaxID=9685 RepID=A0ABI7ZAC2_FELCA